MRIIKVEFCMELPDEIKDHEILQKILAASSTISSKPTRIFDINIKDHNAFAIDIDHQEFDDLKQKIDDLHKTIGKTDAK